MTISLLDLVWLAGLVLLLLGTFLLDVRVGIASLGGALMFVAAVAAVLARLPNPRK